MTDVTESWFFQFKILCRWSPNKVAGVDFKGLLFEDVLQCLLLDWVTDKGLELTHPYLILALPFH